MVRLIGRLTLIAQRFLLLVLTFRLDGILGFTCLLPQFCKLCQDLGLLVTHDLHLNFFTLVLYDKLFECQASLVAAFEVAFALQRLLKEYRVRLTQITNIIALCYI